MVRKAPRGLWGMLLVLGPSLIWCGEYIGSGEVIIATRTGAALGTAVLWAVVVGITLKYWIGLCGARYTVATGEGMVDCFARAPAGRYWLVPIVFIGQVFAGITSIGALAVAAATFLGELIPLGDHSTLIWGSIVTVFACIVVGSGRFSLLKTIMGLLVLVIVIGVLYVAAHTLPAMRELLVGAFGFQVPEVPDWVLAADPDVKSVWSEVLPLLGWAAGGFASQVWYTYWVMGAGYGMAADRKWGMPADEARLASLSAEDARQVRPWLRVVAWDATFALVIGIVVTAAFLVAGAGILRPAQSLPKGPQVAFELSRLFSERWGEVGGTLFILSGTAAMISTQLGQLAGWPRLLADCFRNMCRPFGRIAPRKQFRLFLALFLVTNLTICALFGTSPVYLVKMGAIFDGLLLVPLQALAVAWGLFVAQKRLLSAEAHTLLRPRWYHAAGLVVAFAVFGYFCVFQVPQVMKAMFGG
ncbi:MAG: Nramp family divalent metal transporter [Planctomycetota bacterium]|nr:Nramp family divalent metal transporter [Planctomycetota bacterium]